MEKNIVVVVGWLSSRMVRLARVPRMRCNSRLCVWTEAD